MKEKKIKTLKPPRLKRGDTIGIVAPASHFDLEKFNRGIAVLESMGFNTSVPEGLFNKKGYFAGSDLERAEMVNRYFADTTIKAIMCARGGYGSIRILSLLDYETIQKNPKIFVGFSDVSALLSTLYSRCRLVTFHGPTVTTLGNSDQKTKDSLLSMITSGEKPEIAMESGITIQPGSASGPVLGGNLNTLCHLLGTRFQPDFKGCILFLEDRGEAPYRVDRMLSQMKLAGCFNRLAGFILGTFEDCGNTDDIIRIAGDIFKDDKIPILAGLEVGHGKRNLAIPTGLNATLNADLKVLTFHEPATTG
ncbi:MAG: LD-carboxypeptidase [Desulfobacterales bacterium]|nr:LD-carboxypeptidase [Desulfobacterales bacterium]MDX2508404.1 LD-carboxypeptidase [Desulfobacterales bacterium]